MMNTDPNLQAVLEWIWDYELVGVKRNGNVFSSNPFYAHLID